MGGTLELTLFRRNYGLIALSALVISLCASHATVGILRARIADAGAETEKIDLEAYIPDDFKNWKISNSSPPIIEESVPRQVGEKIYAQVLSRTYVDDTGNEVMLSMVYARDQYREDSQIHRPEICYRAQGFGVEFLRDDAVPLKNHSLTVRRLMTRRGERVEPVSYWMIAGREKTLPGLHRKIVQLGLLLTGGRADGLLVRVSSIATEPNAAFSAQDRFVRDFAESITEQSRGLVFGTATDVSDDS